MKIFGIGLSGCSSLAKSLQMLGYKVFHYPRLNQIFDFAKKYDAITGAPVCLSFEKLDKSFPNSKFILTIRDIDSWLESRELFFSIEEALHSPMYRRTGTLLNEQEVIIRKKLYGSQFFNREKYKEAFLDYHRKVYNYFKNREILIMHVRDGFEKLCPFLNKPISEKNFPVI